MNTRRYLTARCRPPVCIVAMAALCVIAAGAVARAVDVQDAREVPAMEQPLPNLPGNSVTAVVVQLAPGARVPSHHHAGFVFAHVLSGTVRSQLNDGPAVDYRMGQSWVEPPGTQHSLTANPIETDSASLLAIFVASSGAKLTTIGP